MVAKQRTIKSAENAFKIISVLKDQKSATGKEIAEQVGLSKGTIHTYLVTFQQEGYIERTVDGKYRLGFEFINLGLSLRDDRHIYKYGKSEADKLAKDTGEIVGLSLEVNGEIRKIYKRGIPYTSTGSTPGKVLPIHASGAGKIILAHFSEQKINRIINKVGLPQLTPNTITDKDVLFEELAKIREAGYADNVGEQTLGARSLVVGVHRPDDTLAGTIALSGTVSQLNEKNDDKIISQLQSSANQIEINMQDDPDFRSTRCSW